MKATTMFGSTARYKWLTKPLILPCTVRLMSKWKWHDPSSKCKEWVRLYCSPHPCCCCSWLLNKMVPVEKQSKGWKSLNLFQMSLMRLHLSPHNLTYMITGVSVHWSPEAAGVKSGFYHTWKIWCWCLQRFWSLWEPAKLSYALWKCSIFFPSYAGGAGLTSSHSGRGRRDMF